VYSLDQLLAIDAGAVCHEDTDGMNGDLAKRPSQIPAPTKIVKPGMSVTST
jgi:hypothetical protein